MDMVEAKKKYGKTLYFKGGIDKHALRKDPAAIRAELEYKMSAPMLGGGTIFALDHRIPNGVSLENYKYYVNLGREMLGIPPITSEGWERMAFKKFIKLSPCCTDDNGRAAWIFYAIFRL